MVLLAAGGISVLVWAVASRQFRGAEQAKFAVMDDDEVWDTPPAPMAPRRRAGMAAVLAGVFTVVLLSVGITVYKVSMGMRSPAFQREVQSPGGLR